MIEKTLQFAASTRAILLRLAVAVCLATVLAAPGAAQSRHAAMAIDANTGDVLHASAADEPRIPASLTKMMTLYILFGEIEAGRLSYTTEIEVSAAAASVPPSKLGLAPGSKIAIANLVKALVTKSANDMAVAVAERIAGSEAAFARLMTERARRIGMRSTIFRNASGLPAEGQTTTARDMLTLALRLHDDYPRHYRIFSLRHFSYNGETYRNHNTLLFNFAGAEGIKTGYTRASGFNLVSSVKRDGKHVVAAVFGGETAGTRNAHMRTILTRALAKASPVKTRKPGPPMLVANPKPAPRPAPPAPAVALKAEPRPVVRAPLPAAGTARPNPPPAAQGPADLPPAQPAKVGKPSEPEPAIPNPLEVTVVKVRPAATSATLRPAAQSAEPAVLAATMAPRVDFAAPRQQEARTERQMAPAATAPPAATETILAKSANAGLGRMPGTLDQQMAVLAATAAVPRRIEAPPAAALRPTAAGIASTGAVDKGYSPEAVGVALGKPPSTLAAQAQRLDRPTPGPAPAPPAQRLGAAPASSLFEIQIGAFPTPEDAEARLAMVQSKTAAVAGHAALALPATADGRQLYRARFSGFTSEKATAVCLELRRASIDCFVTRAE